MELLDELINERLNDFPDSIREVALGSPHVHDIIQQYSRGSIVTYEEALCRMVVCLANYSRDLQDRQIEIMKNANAVVFKYEGPFVLMGDRTMEGKL